MTPARPQNYGKPYQKHEVALVYLLENSPEVDELLASLLKRTPGAINMVRRWVDGADFPPGAYNEIRRHVEWAKETFGQANKAIVELP